jgi:DNA polymerase-4
MTGRSVLTRCHPEPVNETPILHADLDAFYASVEQRDDPDLAGLPVIVGSGVVLACSYEAKAFGVKTAMNVGQAVRLCPEAKVVPPRMEAYSEASRQVYEVFADTSPVVEGLSIDEAFLDAGGLENISGTPAETARQLRRTVREKVSLAISVGVARTKFLAKIASAAAKPDGLLVVEPDREEEFLHPLPVEALWGVGRVTSEKLRGMGITQVGQIAMSDPERLAASIGNAAAARLVDLANNRDPRPVRPREPRKSIGAQSAFPAGSRNDEEVDALLASLVDRAARRLRAAERRCRTVSVGLRFGDMSRATRSSTLPAPSDGTTEILSEARSLLESLRPRVASSGLTLVGVSLESLEAATGSQLALPLTGEDGTRGEAGEALDRALDDLNERFGQEAVTRASLVGLDRNSGSPILPD